jgi:S-adenosyl-L-methionine hydrolase (adenosine-forming)
LAQPLITLTTDFGLNDHYVGTMKGVILNINPSAQIVDICNSVQSFDILDGALTIAQSYQYFVTDSIHLVIVDPGVGSARRPLLVTTEKHKFIAPDNGVLSLVFAREERISVRHITASHYFLQPVSNTFHGRDVFAAVAGWLSKGVSVDKFGDEITDYARFTAPRPKRVSDRELKAIVMKVDKFGNLITNIAAEDIPQLFSENPPAFTLTVGKAEVTQLNSSYSQGTPGAVFAIVGSMGYLEISTNRAFAAQLAGANKGSEVVLTFAEPQFVPNGE